MKFKYLKYAGILIMLPLFVLYGGPNKNDSNDKSLRKIEGSPSYARFNINNISTFIKNDGESDINPNSNSGFTFPKGSNKQAIFQSGFLWGGIVNGQKRVGGSVYRQGTVPGKILNSGVPVNQLQAEDPAAANVRNYRVRPDYKTGNLSSEIADGEGTEAEIRAQYEKDWNEWPAADGAPYNDVDGNGSYDPAVDIPGVPGADQTIWFVCNDTDGPQALQMYGSPSMGIEEQVTIWGYNTTGALGNMLFRKYKIINKSNTPFDSMFVSMWNDPDNGDASDDYVGCDTTLSLTFCYNGRANDAAYGNTPPATGFDFFQGPIVDGEPTDSAIFDGKIVYGKKNLPMTAHYFFINGSNVYTDPDQGEYSGTIQWFNLFNGAVSTTGETFVDPVSGQPTKFALAGDPLTGQGWVDGIIAGPDDRRAGMAAGPFTMAPGDTQEIVVAEIAAGAFPPVDRLGAVGLLKFYDLQAQLAYDNFFDVPKAPQAPVVSVVPLDQKIVLNWGSNATINQTESYSNNGFEFEGYVVYQLPTASAGFAEARRVATFDVSNGIGKIEDLQFDVETGVVGKRVVQFGSDAGVQRSIEIKNDLFNGGLPLVNGTRYYFAVTSYAYNSDPDAVPNVLENSLNILTIVPHSTSPGVRYSNDAGDILDITHTSGTSDGIVDISVVDPTASNGHDFLVRFNNPDDPSESAVASEWELFDKTANQVVYSSPNLSGSSAGTANDTANYYPIIKGMKVVVASPPEAVKSYEVISGTRWVSGTNAGLEQFFGGLGVGKNFFGSDLSASGYVPVILKFAGGPGSDTPSETNGWSQGAVYWRSDSYAYHGTGWLPITAWDVSDTNNPKQLNLSFVEDAVDGSANNKWDMGWDGTAFSNNGGREYIFINKTPYDPNHYDGTLDGTVSDVLYAMWPAARGTQPYLDAKFELLITPNYPALVSDQYSFTAPSITQSSQQAVEDVKNINVFPNPYYGVNPQELNKYQRFVTFNHLPQKATIRIFNLAGQLVRTIEKNSSDQFQRWDLLTDSGLPVASGLFIVYVDMPDLGTTKILKAAIIQEEQILDRF